MPRGTVRAILPASCAEAFALVHDYERRLAWDTLLQSARLVEGAATAHAGAESICRGRWYLGGFALRTRYISFRPPHSAAVRLVAPAPFFATFAATIRHTPLTADSSVIEYHYYFAARPAALRWLLQPVLQRVLHWETARRLAGLRRFLATRPMTATH
ncbi:MAG TPA: SRPBCC family protein [Pirellulaceae bacterium]|nr:SRPBCC family protein [Pirellulaceae bacterium]